jgi:hypothetical protein
MTLVDASRLEIKLGSFRSGSSMAISDPTVAQRVQEYRRVAGNRMIPLDRRDLKKRLSQNDYFVSKKIDGEFNVLVFDAGEAVLVNPGGTVRSGLPVLEEAQTLLSKAGLSRALVAVELFYARPDGRRPRVHDVSRAARQPDSSADLDCLHLAVFDLIDWGGNAPPSGYANVWNLISSAFGTGNRIKPVPTKTLKNGDEIHELFEEWVEKEGNEGLVIRSDVAGQFKTKPTFSIDAAVVGYTEGVDDRAGMLHDLLVALMRPDGTFQVFARVGGGYSDDERRGFLQALEEIAAGSDYAEVNPDHLAYQMVKPEWVIEVKCLDFITQTTRGATIDRMALDWDANANTWKSVRRLPFVSALSPNFVRRREDKGPRQEDIPVRQVSEIVEIPFLDKDARQLVTQKSEVLKREVYTKVQKGQTMVRKFVLWKTNKEIDGTHPAFVVYFTDFSPNRKTPLERDMKVSSSLEQAEALLAALIQENVVKGWSKTG